LIDGIKSRLGGGARADRAAKPQTKAQRLRAKRRKRIAWRAGLSVLTVIAVVLVAALGAGFVGFRGPSQSLGDLLTVSMLETSALKFVPRIYYSAAEVDAIIARNEVTETQEETDTSMIVIAGPTAEPGEEVAAQPTPPPENLVLSEDGIEVYEVHGATYNGWMMIVQDPSRVTVGVCRENFNSQPGMRLREIAERYGAVAAINGGGFSDGGGVGNGGKPLGLVVSDGKVLNKARPSSEHGVVAGFNQDNVLIVGKLTSEQAQEKGIRDALAFGPALVVNGEAAEVKGSSSGLNPRTAIGQRADGAVLMLVIDGRQASSLGATYADMITVLLEYGAINAVNMDGGSSSLMYYKGEYLNKGVILTGDRDIPTGFVVR
ncbi:MAG: phosphodiester glycosidase family protein, partial [Clostridia bacterium]|nr:phosphodiester glycosidase family protein [Clostridia bacterium]